MQILQAEPSYLARASTFSLLAAVEKGEETRMGSITTSLETVPAEITQFARIGKCQGERERDRERRETRKIGVGGIKTPIVIKSSSSSIAIEPTTEIRAASWGR